jgi:hypothetical protein
MKPAPHCGGAATLCGFRRKRRGPRCFPPGPWRPTDGRIIKERYHHVSRD